jgi:ATP-dependent helicase/nuclease subunit A
MTRARKRLVFSATQPHRVPDRASWWQRMADRAQPLAPSAPHAARAQRGQAIVLPALPLWSAAADQPPTVARPQAEDDAASRLGQAVHRTLEWAGTSQATDDFATLAAAAAREFQADERAVQRLAGLIWRSPSTARFFHGNALRWAGNEVPVGEGGGDLRIDRLVALDNGGSREWWVLDYKLQHAPENVPAYREQMRRYKAAVQKLQPGDLVRCAFITGAGEVTEVDA